MFHVIFAMHCFQVPHFLAENVELEVCYSWLVGSGYDKSISLLSVLFLSGILLTMADKANQEGEKVDMKEQQIQANPPVTDFKLTRPPSKFVKRSPIPSSSTPTGKLLEPSNGASPHTAGTKEFELERVEEMKLPELKELAKSRGVKGYSKLKKKELVELLKS